MSLVIKHEYIITFNVEIVVPDIHRPGNKIQNFSLHARAVCEDTIQDIIDGVAPKDIDRVLCLNLVTGWKDVFDEKLQEVAFNKESFNKIIAHPFIRRAILTAYWHAIYGSRLKN